MLKKNKGLLVLTSLLVLLPMLFGILNWERLPEQVATHFNANNEPDGYSSRAFAVFGLPCLMLAIHVITLFAVSADPKNKAISDKVVGLLFWFCPALNIWVSASVYGTALGKQPDMGLWSSLLIGFIFLVIGNYLPKSARNYTVGLKLPWTLDNDENWNRTHRLAGWCMTIGGLVILLSAPMGLTMNIMLPVVLLTTLIPTVYSYLFYRKQQQEKAGAEEEGEE